MAKLQAFAIRDIQIGLYNRPYFLVSKGQAIRSFTDECNRPSDDNPMYKHPSDYELFYLGEYDEESGLFVSMNPEFVLSGAAVKV